MYLDLIILPNISSTTWSDSARVRFARHARPSNPLLRSVPSTLLITTLGREGHEKLTNEYSRRPPRPHLMIFNVRESSPRVSMCLKIGSIVAMLLFSLNTSPDVQLPELVGLGKPERFHGPEPCLAPDGPSSAIFQVLVLLALALVLSYCKLIHRVFAICPNR